MIKYAWLMVVLLVLACADQEWVYHPGPEATGNFKEDAIACNGTSNRPVGDYNSMALLNRPCMEARGWTLEPK